MGIRLISLVASAMLVSSCGGGKEAVSGSTTEAAASTNSAADEEAIRGQVARWLQLIKAKDAAAIAQMYAEDGAFMPSNAPIAKGRASIEQNWAAMMATPGFELNFAPEQITVASSGDLALNRGTYRLAVAPDGSKQVDTGKYVVVWKKVGGEWKAAADIINSDLPAG